MSENRIMIAEFYNICYLHADESHVTRASLVSRDVMMRQVS